MAVGYLADLFDLLNVRDLDLIAQARAACAHLVLGVLTDDYAEAVHGRRPVVPLEERMTLLRHVRGVDEVVAHDGPWPHHAETATLLFTAEDSHVGYGRDSVRLRPRRRSESPVLRQALQPVTVAVA